MLAAFFSTHTLDHLLQQYGYAAVLVFVMIESLGVPFPGETMLIAAALYAGVTHNLEIGLIWAAAAVGAIVGDNIGYGIGYGGGYRLLLRYGDKVRLDEAKLKVGRLIFAEHGGKVVFFGRFVSILRTYAAFLAGTSKMLWRKFLPANAAGGILWSAIYTTASYLAGKALQRASGVIDLIIGIAAVLVIAAVVLVFRRQLGKLGSRAEAAYPGPLELTRQSGPAIRCHFVAPVTEGTPQRWPD